MKPSVVDAALALKGTPFRLYGRDPAQALDCVGFVEAVLSAAGSKIQLPERYRLRNRSIEPMLRFASAQSVAEIVGPGRAGDIILYRLPDMQHHLAILLEHGRIAHAHAGLGRVVIGRQETDWQILKIWRPNISREE